MRAGWVVLLCSCAAKSPPQETPKNEITVEDEVIARGTPAVAPEPAGSAQEPVGSGSAEGSAGSADATASGGRDRESIRRVMRAHIGSLRYCYEKELMNRPDIAGTTVATFTIAPDGTVASATATGFDPSVDECVAKAVQALRFAAAPGATTVNYPFKFTAAQ